MLKAISTYVYVKERLHPGLLDGLVRGGAQAIEIFAARQHLDYANRKQHVREIADWFRTSGVQLNSVHAPLYGDYEWGRTGALPVNVTSTDRAGRIEVNGDLTVPGLPFIFVAGDVAAVRDAAGKPVPGLAPAAKQMGTYAGKKIEAELAGKRMPPFRYRHEGDLAVIGRGAAVVHIGRFSLKGFLGWLFWGGAHIFFLIGVRNRLLVAISWLWYYLTFHSGARLITGYVPARSACPEPTPEPMLTERRRGP